MRYSNHLFGFFLFFFLLYFCFVYEIRGIILCDYFSFYIVGGILLMRKIKKIQTKKDNLIVSWTDVHTLLWHSMAILNVINLKCNRCWLKFQKILSKILNLSVRNTCNYETKHSSLSIPPSGKVYQS